MKTENVSKGEQLVKGAENSTRQPMVLQSVKIPQPEAVFDWPLNTYVYLLNYNLVKWTSYYTHKHKSDVKL